jgi:uncharacterized protein YacL (UPF0231 family)
MDVDFVYDSLMDEHILVNSGDHTALVNFLNENFSGGRGCAVQLRHFMEQLNTNATTINFKEWQVQLDDEEVEMIRHKFGEDTLGSEAQTDLHVLNDMEWELQCLCGKEDLLLLLENWCQFIEEK